MQEQAKPHGCLCPFHPFQLTSYILFAFHAFAFYFINLIVWQSSPGLLYGLTVPYSLAFAGVVVADLAATFTDPTDPTVYSERKRRENK